ncbi:MAG TPA: hypothetical protein VGC23_08110, partial [Vicinamibacterales bacterium]
LDIFAADNPAVHTNECWAAYGAPFAQLFCYFDVNLGTYIPSYSRKDYVGEIFAYNATDASMGVQFGLLGFADDNWVDGTQTFVFAFGADIYRDSGFGFTATVIHEVGHHIGMSHPHDGYDSELALDYGASGEYYYAWEGDESDTVMQYLSITNKFGEHNRDNMYRWETAGYLNWSNALAGAIMDSEDADDVFYLVQAADFLAQRARSRFNSWQYLTAVTDARLAYGLLVTAANHIGVSSERLTAARMMLPPSRIEKYVCRPRALTEALANR